MEATDEQSEVPEMEILDERHDALGLVLRGPVADFDLESFREQEQLKLQTGVNPLKVDLSQAYMQSIKRP
jgi:hypothetical protein